MGCVFVFSGGEGAVGYPEPGLGGETTCEVIRLKV